MQKHIEFFDKQPTFHSGLNNYSRTTLIQTKCDGEPSG